VSAKVDRKPKAPILVCGFTPGSITSNKCGITTLIAAGFKLAMTASPALEAASFTEASCRNHAVSPSQKQKIIYYVI
jgi:hypothetical protein